MSIDNQGNTDLAFDTDVFRNSANQYKNVADEMRSMASRLNSLLLTLKSSGWTTPAGTAFQSMVDTNWKQNIDKYAALLDTLCQILIESAGRYDTLMETCVRQTKLNYSE